MHFRKMVPVVLAIVACIVHGTFGGTFPVKVKTGWLSGDFVKSSIDDVYYFSYKGIPYARPPVGDLRFKDPQPAQAWSGIRNASAHGAICPQVNMLTNEYHPGSEDCLFLNVYTPSIYKTHDLYPVIIFIHGGVYKFGSGNDDYYGPDFFMTQNVVLVTINYRMDVLGFLNMGTKEVPGNAGLKDQVMAMKWVQTNIAKFGGNPMKVTIMGESAGSAAVSLHLLSPMSKGLFQRAVCLSGVGFDGYSTSRYPTLRPLALSSSLGFNSKNSTEILAFLQNADVEKIINSTSAVLAYEDLTSFFINYVPFVPSVELDVGQENIFMSQDPLQALTTGCVNDAELLLGYVENEATTFVTYIQTYMPAYHDYPQMFVPSDIVYNCNTDTILEQSRKIIDFYLGDKIISLDNMADMVSFVTNYTFVYDIHRFARKFSKYNNVYMYKFLIDTDRNYYARNLGASYNITGPAHMDDLAYLFDPKALNMPLKPNTIEYDMVKMWTTLVTNFTTYGNPTPSGARDFIWPTYDEDNLFYLELSNNPRVNAAADECDVQFWKSIYENAGVPF